MSTIRPVKNKVGVAWRAQVYVRGHRESKRFRTKPEAQQWALEREIELRRGADLVGGKTLGDAFQRYAAEIPKNKRGYRWEQIRLQKFARDPLARVPAADLNLDDGESYIERCLAAGLSANTVIREMNLIKPVVRAMVKWRWIDSYPWNDLKMPPAGKRRSKLYTQSEIDSILALCGLPCDVASTSTQQVGVAFLIATESGMRLNEICSIKDDWWNRSANYVSLPHWITKTDTARDVPLSSIANDALHMLEVRDNGNLFSINAQTASTMFRRIRKRAGIHDGTFHDSRHYAVTKLSKKLNVMDLARVIGHSDIRQLMTYYESDAASLAKMLD